MTDLAHKWEGDPLRYDGVKLFILDAKNSVERRHLIDWLHGTWGSANPSDIVTLSLSDDGAPQFEPARR